MKLMAIPWLRVWLVDEAHLPEIGEDTNFVWARPVGGRKVHEERTTHHQLARNNASLNLVDPFGAHAQIDPCVWFGPETTVQAHRAVVAQAKELIVFQLDRI